MQQHICRFLHILTLKVMDTETSLRLSNKIIHRHYNILFLKILFIYFRERGREGERERNINVWLCALTGNQTGDSLVRRPVLSPLSHTSQGLTFSSILQENVTGYTQLCYSCLGLQVYIWQQGYNVRFCFVYTNIDSLECKGKYVKNKC